MNCKSRILGSSLGLLLLIAPHADAQKRRAQQQPPKDNATYTAALARSAETCPEHSEQRTRPGVVAVPAAALKVLESRGYALCPDTRLDTTTPVVWYGKQGVFAWNPASAGAPKKAKAKSAVRTDRLIFCMATMAVAASAVASAGITRMENV